MEDLESAENAAQARRRSRALRLVDGATQAWIRNLKSDSPGTLASSTIRRGTETGTQALRSRPWRLRVLDGGGPGGVEDGVTAAGVDGARRKQCGARGAVRGGRHVRGSGACTLRDCPGWRLAGVCDFTDSSVPSGRRGKGRRRRCCVRKRVGLVLSLKGISSWTVSGRGDDADP